MFFNHIDIYYTHTYISEHNLINNLLTEKDDETSTFENLGKGSEILIQTLNTCL